MESKDSTAVWLIGMVAAAAFFYKPIAGVLLGFAVFGGIYLFYGGVFRLFGIKKD